MRAVHLFTLFIALLLSACGFQLRGLGSYELAFSQLALSSEDPHSALTRAVQLRLQSQGIDISPAAEFGLHLGREQHERRRVSGSPGSHSAEYQLSNSLSYSIRSGNLPALVSGQVQVQRNLVNNQNQTSASDEEERLLRSEMRDELVMQLMLRLHALQPEQLQLRKEQELKRLEAESAAARELQLQQQQQTPAAP